MKVTKISESSQSGLSNILRQAVQERVADGVSNSRQRSTVMGVRGLDESDEMAFAGNVKPNLRMVYNLESFGNRQDLVERIMKLIC